MDVSLGLVRSRGVKKQIQGRGGNTLVKGEFLIKAVDANCFKRRIGDCQANPM
jgi:hypothetical protein